VAAGLVAVWPNLVFHTAVALSETLFIAVLLAALALLLARPWGELSRGRLLAFGAVLGLSVLVRPVSAVIVPLVFVVGVVTGLGWRRALAHVTWVGIAVVAVVTPWLLRNIDAMGTPVLSTNLGDDLCIGHNPQATGRFVLADPCLGRHEELPSPEREIRRDEDNRELAIDYALSHPRDEASLLRRKVMGLFANDYDGLDAAESFGQSRFLTSGARGVLRFVSNLWFWGVTAVAVLGLPILFSRKDPRRLLLALSLVAVTLLPLAFFGEPRFKLPSLPLLAIPAAVTLMKVVRRRWVPNPCGVA